MTYNIIITELLPLKPGCGLALSGYLISCSLFHTCNNHMPPTAAGVVLDPPALGNLCTSPPIISAPPCTIFFLIIFGWCHSFLSLKPPPHNSQWTSPPLFFLWGAFLCYYDEYFKAVLKFAALIKSPTFVIIWDSSCYTTLPPKAGKCHLASERRQAARVGLYMLAKCAVYSLCCIQSTMLTVYCIYCALYTVYSLYSVDSTLYSLEVSVSTGEFPVSCPHEAARLGPFTSTRKGECRWIVAFAILKLQLV